MFFYTADEHFGHRNIIQYCDRPFSSVEEMDREIIRRHNEVVKDGDTVIHAGDLGLASSIPRVYKDYISKLNGKHIFLRGSHDAWMKRGNGKSYFHEIFERKVNGTVIVVCHYAMRTWAASHYNSIHLYGHSHGKLDPIGKSWDIGVDNNDFYPISEERIFQIMEERPDNPNLIRQTR